MRNYYAILGIRPDCRDVARIKAQYRRLARLYHPDRNRSPEAPARFRAILEAYEVLSDAQRRAAYEAERAAWLRQQGAVGCDACGQANRIEPSKKGIPTCGRCDAPLPTVPPAVDESEIAGVVRARLPELYQRVGGALLSESAALVDGVLEASFTALRRRMGLGKDRA